MVRKNSEKIEKMNDLPELPKKIPAHLVLEVTTQCNYQCPYCYCFWHEFPEKKPTLLDTAGWKILIDRCRGKGVKEFTFTGGEALLRQDIGELLDHAVRAGARVSLFTNGSLMDEKMFSFCREREIAISTSLQGLRSHGKMTGTAFGYRKTLELIALGRQENWPVAVNITVSRANRDEIGDVFAAAALCGASLIQLGPMMPEGRGQCHIDQALTADEWENVKQDIRAVKECEVPYAFCDEIICQCRPHSPEILRRFSVAPSHPCNAGKNFGVIGPDGKYRKCLHSLPV